ncbi:hypothetical protein GQ55_9G644200 [Panicum hallii var. hallii]|uniref:Uncharacterized protein n=1 Tax=Panicum hallii var. hallii TaxID=1504633 RepID=A0A2T7CIS3_9POAL|nr:hypothetical protein GQ55_9G644200 [Panicum hallii var. hallii]PUZ43210.1 hypothetical protein GQ55_9G644200 [Panicum hallii var. hallii]PUZ43211.1 hypothetical protein GQ55_9G644200 [Panicum hallii var. hallii]PUZ43212.1 hypothetical protein GQ55_9G644200 [Panicum hallii var. hallii]
MIGQEKKDMSRSELIIQRSIQHHGTIIIMVHLLGCTVSTSTEMDPLEAFYSEVNDRHGLSTALAPLHLFCLRHTHIIQPYVQVQPCKSRNSVLVGGAAVELERWDDRTPIPVEMKMGMR